MWAGLAAYIFTTNIQRSWRVTEALEYGIVGINEGLVSTEVCIPNHLLMDSTKVMVTYCLTLLVG